jgi:hypothetical protein
MPAKLNKSYTAGPVPKEAVDYFQQKGWKVGFSHLDVWKEEHAHAFTVAKAMEVDVLESIRGAVDQAIAEGRTFRDFQKTLQPELEKLGWWGKKEMVDPKTGETKLVQLGSPRRLQIIFRQNLRSAQAAGQWERIERTKDFMPYLKYELGPSRKHRDQHVQWSGLILPVDDSFWETHFPPNGWGCKCRVLPMSEDDAENEGGISKSPPIRYKKWQNPRTGEIEEVPEGITPGFDFNPGKARTGEQLKRFAERLDSTSPTAADAVQRAWMQPQIFGQWRAKPQGNIPVAALDKETQVLLGSDTRTVLLSAESMGKQLAQHSDLEDWEYCLLPEILAKGAIYRQDEERLVYFRHGEYIYRAAVKATLDRRENYLVHFQRLPKRNYRNQIKAYEQLREEMD